MKLNDYQKEAYKTALPSSRNLGYMALGLGEAGEVQNKVKKLIRDFEIEIWKQMPAVPISSIEDRQKFEKIIEHRRAIIQELGGLLWYVAGCATELNASLNDIAEENLEILRSRKERNVIKGSGDNR